MPQRGTAGRLALGMLFLVAGSAHFVRPALYRGIMPGYLPVPGALVAISGAAEIAGGLGVLLPQTRRLAAWGLVALLVAVFPANLWMVQHPERFHGIPPILLWVRLPLQLPLIAWAWLYTRPRLLDRAHHAQGEEPSVI